jgi:hypothetical protein
MDWTKKIYKEDRDILEVSPKLLRKIERAINRPGFRYLLDEIKYKLLKKGRK